MQSRDPRRFKRAHLEPGSLWGSITSELPSRSAIHWNSCQLRQALGRALSAYLTHLIPGVTGNRSLAADSLAFIGTTESLDDCLDQVVWLAPELFRWQVYVTRRAHSFVWDPIHQPLTDFLLRYSGSLSVVPAPSIEGPGPDPDSIRFVLRAKLLQAIANPGQLSAASCP